MDPVSSDKQEMLYITRRERIVYITMDGLDHVQVSTSAKRQNSFQFPLVFGVFWVPETPDPRNLETCRFPENS